MEKTLHYMEVCLQDKIRSSNSKDLKELCLQKSSLKSVLKDSKANKIPGHVDSERGDRINCSLTTRKIQKETQEKHTKEKGTESSKEVSTYLFSLIYFFHSDMNSDPDRILSISIMKTKKA